jgi:hypothetical protein
VIISTDPSEPAMGGLLLFTRLSLEIRCFLRGYMMSYSMWVEILLSLLPVEIGIVCFGRRVVLYA